MESTKILRKIEENTRAINNYLFHLKKIESDISMIKNGLEIDKEKKEKYDNLKFNGTKSHLEYQEFNPDF